MSPARSAERECESFCARAKKLDFELSVDGTVAEQRLYQLVRQPNRIVGDQGSVEPPPPLPHNTRSCDALMTYRIFREIF
jgi:hypothetical protein